MPHKQNRHRLSRMARKADARSVVCGMKDWALRLRQPGRHHDQS
jgi:hypothetical protein